MNPSRFATTGLVFGAVLAALTGCQHDVQRAVPSTNFKAQFSPVGATTVIPLPERTPFDDDPVLRAVYLQSYANGYGLAVTSSEYASPGCLCEANGDQRRYDAMADGFFAGREAGAAAYRARQTAAANRQSN